MVCQILESDATDRLFRVQASDKASQNALTAISDAFHENKELSSCRVDKQIPNYHPKSLHQLGITARDPMQIALKYRAFCLRSIFCLNVGKSYLIRAVWVKFTLYKFKDTIFQRCINRPIFRFTALNLGIRQETLVEILIPMEAGFIIEFIVHILTI